MHCSYSVLGAWCRSHARPSGSFKAPHLNPSHVPSLASVRIVGTHCLYAVLALPTSAYTLPCAALRYLHAPMCYLALTARAYALPVSDRGRHACLGAHASSSHCICLPNHAPKARAGCAYGMAMTPHFPSLHAPPLKSILGHIQKF